MRAQEFVLRASSNPEGPFRESAMEFQRTYLNAGDRGMEIVRQQWNFSPPETAREDEEYQVELSNVTIVHRAGYEWRTCSRLAQESAVVLKL